MWQIRQDPGRNGKRPRRALISHGARTILHEDSRSFIAPILLSGRNRWRDVCSANSLPSRPSTALACFRKRPVGVKLWLSQVHRLTLERSGEPGLHYESLPPEEITSVKVVGIRV